MNDTSDFEPIVLGDISDLTKGGGSGLSEASGYKNEGGTLDQQPYQKLPSLPQA